MKLNNLKKNKDLVFKEMEVFGYSKSYIENIKYQLKHFFSHYEKYNSYKEYCENEILNNKFIKISTKQSKIDKINFIMNYDLYGTFPNWNKSINSIFTKKKYYYLNDEFRNLIDKFIDLEKNNKKENTYKVEANNCIIFLLYLQKSNINTLKDVSESIVINYFLDDNCQNKFSQSLKKKIKRVFKVCSSFCEECKRIEEYFPLLRHVRKNIQYLTNDEIDAIKETLENSKKITIRDKAIMSLLLYTGIRSCDIANLKLTDIDWQKNKIEIIQQKTSQLLELPLIPAFGNVIYDYIKNERPNVNINNVFIKYNLKQAITTSSIQNTVAIVMSESNIRMKKGERRGTHLFRYNIVTALLNNDVSQPIITSTLGHTNPKSLDPYLSINTKELYECSISIEKFPCIFLEVFNDSV
ncbi:MAG: tyrosine-type recombinase/integrase [Mycoplasmatota bacterium]